MHRPHLRLPATLQATNVEPNCGYDSFVFGGQVFLCLPKLLTTATGLSAEPQWCCAIFFFLLAAYIVFHKIFPFGLFRTRLADMTGADLLLLIARSLVATIGAAYFVVTGFIQPALHDRDRLWREQWTGLAFGVIAIAVGSVLISILEKKGIIVIAAHWVASCILWLLF